MTEHRPDRKRASPLSIEDRILWNKVARTVSPLDRDRQRAAQEQVWTDWVADAFGEEEPARPAKPGKLAVPKTVQKPQASPAPHPVRQRTSARAGVNPIEQPVWRKLSRGRVPIDASIDLHNMTQDEAHNHLHRFLVQARARDCRHVLVITGKGRSPASDGVLRRMVPQWLAREPFAGLVSGVRSASRGHGGEGALYVRLKKLAVHGAGGR